jgi:hypothetical protein
MVLDRGTASGAATVATAPDAVVEQEVLIEQLNQCGE